MSVDGTDKVTNMISRDSKDKAVGASVPDSQGVGQEGENGVATSQALRQGNNCTKDHKQLQHKKRRGGRRKNTLLSETVIYSGTYKITQNRSTGLKMVILDGVRKITR